MSSITGVYDRDWGGNLVNEHFSLPARLPNGEVAAFTALTPDHVYNQCSVGVCAALRAKPVSGGPSDAGTNPPGLPADARRTDGYLVDGNVFQGARVYDPNANQRTTPDDYGGDVDAPMSQKPYAWNNNNGMAYSDPSGYDGVLFRDASNEGMYAENPAQVNSEQSCPPSATYCYGKQIIVTTVTTAPSTALVNQIQQDRQMLGLWTGFLQAAMFFLGGREERQLGQRPPRLNAP